MDANAHFYIFKPTGKYYTDSRGYVPEEVFMPYLGHGDEQPSSFNTRKRLIEANNGHMPGMGGPCMDYLVVVVLDKDVSYGWPIALKPLEG